MIKKIIYILLFSCLFSSPLIKSLILPGWGELSQGDKKRGKIFLYSESLLVIGAYSFNSLSDIYRSDYITYAKVHADVDINSQDYMFALDVGSDDNIGNFNHIKRQGISTEMRVDSNGNIIREYGREVYPEGTKYDWNWNSDSNRQKFNSMRIKSINYEKYVTFALAGMILNRVISLIDVMIISRNMDANISSVIIPKGYDGLELQFYIKF